MTRLTPEREKELRDWASQPADFPSEVIHELLDEIDTLREERDLAIAHDRQPYPTAHAYMMACQTVEKLRIERDQLNLEITTLKKDVQGWKEYAKNLIFK